MSTNCSHAESEWAGPAPETVKLNSGLGSVFIRLAHLVTGEELYVRVNEAHMSHLGDAVRFNGRTTNGDVITDGHICADRSHFPNVFVGFTLTPMLSVVAESA